MITLYTKLVQMSIESTVLKVKKHFKCKAAAYFYVKFKRVVNYRSNTTTLR